jgi:hypothetical protein
MQTKRGKAGITDKGLEATGAVAWQAMDEAMRWALFASPAERLDWLFTFLREDGNRLPEAEQIQATERLLTFNVPNCIRPARPAPGDLRTDLQQLQTEINRGLHGIVAESSEPWEIPGPPSLWLSRRSVAHKEGEKAPVVAPHVTTFNLQWKWGQDLRASVLAGIAYFIQQHGHNVRGCLECGAPFLAVRRQVFCNPLCAQKSRDRRKAKA